jgi:hypothetical protein
MNTTDIATELQARFATALEHRKQAYKLRLSRDFIRSVNHSIRTLQAELAELGIKVQA